MFPEIFLTFVHEMFPHSYLSLHLSLCAAFLCVSLCVSLSMSPSVSLSVLRLVGTCVHAPPRLLDLLVDASTEFHFHRDTPNFGGIRFDTTLAEYLGQHWGKVGATLCKRSHMIGLLSNIQRASRSLSDRFMPGRFVCSKNEARKHTKTKPK